MSSSGKEITGNAQIYPGFKIYPANLKIHEYKISAEFTHKKLTMENESQKTLHHRIPPAWCVVCLFSERYTGDRREVPPLCLSLRLS